MQLVKWLVIVTLLSTGSSTAWADTATPLNDPQETWQQLVGVVDTLKPQGGVMFDVQHSDFRGVGTVALYEVRKNDQGLGSLRVGYAGDHAAIGGLEVNLANLAPQTWPIVPVLAKYLKVGVAGGWDFNDKEAIWGPSVTVQATF